MDVSCVDCGSGFTISRRTYRERSEAGKSFQCTLCRTFEIAPPARRRCCTRRDYADWIRRLGSPAAVDQVVRGIWPSIATLPANADRRHTILASAAPRKGGKRAA